MRIPEQRDSNQPYKSPHHAIYSTYNDEEEIPHAIAHD